MKTYRAVATTEFQVVRRTCDRCTLESDDVYVHTLQIDGGYGSALDCTVIEIELCDRCIAALLLSLAHPINVVRGEELQEGQVEGAAGNLRVVWAEHTERPRASSRTGNNPYAHADGPPNLPDRVACGGCGRGRCTDHFRSAIFCEHANECPAVCPCTPDCYCRTEGTCR